MANKPSSAPQGSPDNGNENQPAFHEFLLALKEEIKDSAVLKLFIFKKGGKERVNLRNVLLFWSAVSREELNEDFVQKVVENISEKKSLQKKLKALIEKREGLPKVMEFVQKVREQVEAISNSDSDDDEAGKPGAAK